MDISSIKCSSIIIKNIKNTKNGCIDFSSGFVENVSGIYGQNGSGKTTIIECFDLFYNMLKGREQKEIDLYNFMNADEDNSNIEFEFTVKRPEKESITVWYEVFLKKRDQPEAAAYVSHEKISIRENTPKNRKKTALQYFSEETSLVTKPKKYFTKDLEKALYGKMAIAKYKNTSFLLSDESEPIFDMLDDEYLSDIMLIFNKIRIHMSIVTNQLSNGVINSKLSLPINVRFTDEVEGLKYNEYILFEMEESMEMPDYAYDAMVDILSNINIVLPMIIPNLKITMNVIAETTDGNENMKTIQFYTLRGDSKRLPLSSESDGIKKIISLMGGFISVYNDPLSILLVDEIDAGIYEFLLGEILSVLSSGAKGQVIFTSHNLRPLEVLDEKNIILTTSNEDNRFISAEKLKQNKNLRNSYIQSIQLDEEAENLYVYSNKSDIQLALIKAGRVQRR